MMVVKIILIKIDPGTLRAYKTIVIISPITARRAGPCKEPNPMIVPVSPTTIFAFASPMSAIKSPIPTATAFFRFAGIASIIASRTLKNDKIIKRSPSSKTEIGRASCRERV